MTQPTPEMLKLARECAAKYWQTGDPSDEASARAILTGEWDDQAYTQAALAAIQRTSELAAAYALKVFDGPPGFWAQTALERYQAALIARDHLKGQSDE